MEDRKDIVFNDYELGAINIVILNEIALYKKIVEKNDFSYESDRQSAKEYLKTLMNIDNKINKRECED